MDEQSPEQRHSAGRRRFARSGTDPFNSPMHRRDPAPPARSRSRACGRAVVLGGSIAGLMAARVLSDHADEVVIIEADELDAGVGARRGVPQSDQLHGLLDMGRVQFDRWFPGFSAELIAAGAELGEGAALRMYIDGVEKVSVPDNTVISATRPFIEGHLRRRMQQCDRVRWIHGRARGLDIDDTRVTGCRDPPAGSAAPETVSSDLVVDATGRGSRLSDWVTKAGWPAPKTDRMDIDLGYATALFRRGPELGDVVAVHSLASPVAPGQPQADSMAVSRVEDNRWIVVIAGYAEHRPTNDREDFLRRLNASEVSAFRTIAESCTLLGEIDAYRMPHSRRTNFHQLDRFPGGLVAAGDAVASFNPVYGQGMASAALHASCLSAYLSSQPDLRQPAREYFKHVAVIVDAAWGVSTMGDLALPHVQGPYPRGYRIAKFLGERIARASIVDARVNALFLDVIHMRRHPKVFSSPRALLLVERGLRRRAVPQPHATREQTGVRVPRTSNVMDM